METMQNHYIGRLKSENEFYRKENFDLRMKISSLQEQLNWLQRQVFGKRSERYIEKVPSKEEQLYLSEELKNLAESAPVETREVAAHTRRKVKEEGNDKLVIPENLPVEEQVIDIPEKKKICSETGVALVKIGEEITTKLAHKPGSYFIKRIIRPKYGLPQGEGVLCEELPDAIIPRCRVDESFLAKVLIEKFADHLPLYRISERLSREGIGISRQLLSQWVIRIGTELAPLRTCMEKEILKSGNVFIDETPVDIQVKGLGKVHQAYMWCLVGGRSADPPYRTYHFRMSRKHHHAQEIIGDYGGVLHSDKYGAYQTLAQSKQITWCPCWSHIRRKFEEAQSGDKDFREWVLGQIQELFLMERKGWEKGEEERLQIRKEQEEPIIDELIEAIKKKIFDGKVLPKSKFREALGYFTGLIPYLKNYIKEPYARIDNNVAERAIRALAIGRKNWLFVGSEKGGEAAAVIYSLVQTCRGLKVNPQEYLEDVLRRIMAHSNQKLNELLPDQWQKQRGI